MKPSKKIYTAALFASILPLASSAHQPISEGYETISVCPIFAAASARFVLGHGFSRAENARPRTRVPQGATKCQSRGKQ
jgi:hypothetical protein